MAGADIAAGVRTAGTRASAERRLRPYLMFIWPALIVSSALIVFPWIFTIWMSLHDWHIGSASTFVWFDNYTNLATNRRFLEAVGHTRHLRPAPR